MKAVSFADHLGRTVRKAWVAWAREQPEPRPGWLVSWKELDEGQREVDRRIGLAVAEELLQILVELVDGSLVAKRYTVLFSSVFIRVDR